MENVLACLTRCKGRSAIGCCNSLGLHRVHRHLVATAIAIHQRHLVGIAIAAHRRHRSSSASPHGNRHRCAAMSSLQFIHHKETIGDRVPFSIIFVFFYSEYFFLLRGRISPNHCKLPHYAHQISQQSLYRQCKMLEKDKLTI